jgi:hypothetical protein
MATAITLAWATLLWAQTATRPAGGGDAALAKTSAAAGQIGVVTGNNVYVRSGFHSNYYPVTKLNKGDKVTVVGGEFGWLKILPPQGTFSLVDKTYVDKTDDSGVINARVWVFAGSELDNRRYAKQVKLHSHSRRDRGRRVLQDHAAQRGSSLDQR